MTDLTLTVLIPLLGAVVVIATPRGDRTSRPIGIVVALVSLALAQWGAFHSPAATFLLLPSRVWELLTGALVAPARGASSTTMAPMRGRSTVNPRLVMAYRMSIARSMVRAVFHCGSVMRTRSRY